MSRQYLAQNEEPKEVVTLFGDGTSAILVPDSALLFSGEFYRLGPDLYIVNDAEASYRIPDYFAYQPAVDLHDPNGAILRGDLVERLAGPIAPGQYAQVGDVAEAGPIGQVETVEGTTSVQRADGTEETLQVGMKIFQNDVIATEEDAAVSVTFVDGTIFTLAAASRMVIDELIYNPNADDNTGSFSLIQGSFVFIAGQVAKTGGMDVNTPSSTMGIRGTTVVVQIASEGGVDTTEVTLTTDPDGGKGRVELRDIDGNLIAFITDTNTKWIVSADNTVTREVDRTLQDTTEDNLLIAEAFAAFRLATARLDAGEAFVTLSDTSSRSNFDQQSAQPPTSLEVDSIDEIDSIEAPPDVEREEPIEGSDTIDDTLIIDTNDEGPVLVVTGLEDSSPSAPISGDIGDVAGNLVFALDQGPANGTVVVRPDGGFDYVPEPDFNGTDTFTYIAIDSGGNVIEGSVVVNVLPVNDAPQAEDSVAVVMEDGIFTGSINASDVDGDLLSFAINEVPTNGEVVLLQDGTYAYQPNSDFFGTDSFSVIVSDPDGETAEATVTITVSPMNDAPVITTTLGQARGALAEDDDQVEVQGQLMAEDVDEDATITWTGVSTAVFGVFAIDANGAWSYELDSILADSISEDEVVVETMTATARDEFGAEATQIVEVTLTGTNDAPTVTPNTVFEADTNEAIAGQLSASDVDSEDALSFAAGDDAPQNGVVTINGDGSFVYTPNAGFAGVDRFSYTVTDAEGGVSVGRVTTVVEATSGGAGEASVTVDVVGDASDSTAAGALVIDAEAADAIAVNLVVAMDSSGSIGAAAWTEQKEAVADAVAQLAQRFEGSDTEVEVQIISYSRAASAIGPFSLQDPALAEQILDLPFLRGTTRWDLALDEANEFFAAQPAGEANFLLFITDGVPTSEAWRDSLDALQNSPDAAFSLDIQAFGIGASYDPALLQEIDPEPTLLESSADLASALTATPVFSPSLISLDVALEVDGVDKGVIATETSDALTVDGIDYALPLASIENIDTLLGESNRISVTARFDLDGDRDTAEVELFKSDVIGKADTAQVVSGFADHDLLFGGQADDTIQGHAGDDVILGFDGNDTIDGGTGADVVLAGAGDDVVRVGEVSVEGLDVIDGGLGRDILDIDVAGNLTDDLIPSLDIRNIEAIDMENGLGNTLELTLADVVDLSATSDSQLEALLDAALPESAVIYGDAGDQLTLLGDAEGGFQKVAGAPVDDGQGNTLDIYNYVQDGNVLATLGVDTDIEVSGAVPVV